MSYFIDRLPFFFFQAEDGIRDAQESRGLGDVYKRQGEAEAERDPRDFVQRMMYSISGDVPPGDYWDKPLIEYIIRCTKSRGSRSASASPTPGSWKYSW